MDPGCGWKHPMNIFFLIRIHSIHSWTVTTRHGLKKKKKHRKIKIKQKKIKTKMLNYVCPLVLLSFHPEIFLGLAFSQTQHDVRGPCVVVRDRQIFFIKKFYPRNWENGSKIAFFGFIGKFSDYFFLNLVYKESLFYLLYSSTNPWLGKNLVPEIWAKML